MTNDTHVWHVFEQCKQLITYHQYKLNKHFNQLVLKKTVSFLVATFVVSYKGERIY